MISIFLIIVSTVIIYNALKFMHLIIGFNLVEDFDKSSDQNNSKSSSRIFKGNGN